MADDGRQWTLEGLIDFEQAVDSGVETPAVLRDEVLAAARDRDGASARRAGFAVWRDGIGGPAHGAGFTGALSLVGGGLALVLFLSGATGVLGILDRARGGIHVTLFLAVLLGVQWLVLLFALVAWLFRRKGAEGFSMVQALVGRLARRFSGEPGATWWGRLMRDGGAPRAAVLWRLARIIQGAGVAFNIGIACALGGLVLVRHIGFYWETTTDVAMHTLLERITGFLAVPWSAWWPAAVPDAAVIDATRWTPGSELPPGPAAWWMFLLMATLVWGMLPRLLLWLLAWRCERKALASLDFQSRGHRALWRDLSGAGREDTSEKPLDGVLVLDVGGGGWRPDELRPFLLRRLRVNPAAWHPVAVLDDGAEDLVSQALEKAPAGVVLLAEGWALSPPRMSALHRRVRAAAPDCPLRFLVANLSEHGMPKEPEESERAEWERFVDSLRDPDAEVFFYEAPPA
ncbi:MAG: DUF2868 domain-containing protein [Verrucomicrobiae bacterium]|nr:DUF2868 domain-containing protein [Verrucomicrobiae bacterium]